MCVCCFLEPTPNAIHDTPSYTATMTATDGLSSSTTGGSSRFRVRLMPRIVLCCCIALKWVAEESRVGTPAPVAVAVAVR